MGALQFLIPCHEPSINIFPCKHSLNSVSLLVDRSIRFKRVPQRINLFVILAASWVRMNYRDKPLSTNGYPVCVRIKSGIKRQERASEIKLQQMGNIQKSEEWIIEQDCVMMIYGTNHKWSYDIPLIIRYFQSFLALLMFMPRISYLLAPFLATVFEPSPCRIERSSCPWSSSSMTDERNKLRYEPSFDQRLCHL